MFTGAHRVRVDDKGRLAIPAAFRIEGRGEESLRVLIGVALLRSLDRIPREGEIDFKGADYQRGKGTRFYDAAHRFPCTPKIKAWSVPHYAGSKRLERALERPLERTDYLPKPVNYADRLFEVNGACEAVVEAVRFVMHEQPVGKPVHIKMIRHAWEFKLWKDFDKAYNDAWQEAAANEEGIDLLDESALERLDAIRSSPGSINFRQPRANMQLVQDALWYSAFMARRHSEPAMVRSENITTYEQRLLKLSKEN